MGTCLKSFGAADGSRNIVLFSLPLKHGEPWRLECVTGIAPSAAYAKSVLSRPRDPDLLSRRFRSTIILVARAVLTGTVRSNVPLTRMLARLPNT